jgi:hypothetical protein
MQDRCYKQSSIKFATIVMICHYNVIATKPYYDKKYVP